jgi:hypothetical protein
VRGHVFLYSIHATRDGSRSRIGTTVFFFRPDDKKFQRFNWWGNVSRIVAPFPGAVSIYFIGSNHYNRISPIKTAILSSVPVLQQHVLRWRQPNYCWHTTKEAQDAKRRLTQYTDNQSGCYVYTCNESRTRWGYGTAGNPNQVEVAEVNTDSLSVEY